MADRLERLRVAKRLSWGELCTLIDIKRSMLHYLRKGQRNLSFPALRRLEDAEREAGILPPAPVNPVAFEPVVLPELSPSKNIKISPKGGEKGDELAEIAALLREAADRLEAYQRRKP